MKCKSILIAEDHDDIRETLEDILKMEGYRVHSVKNGREALLVLKKLEGPTLILLDLMMPIMNGWEFLEAQKENNILQPLSVVIVSAIAAESATRRKNGEPVQASGYIRKPVSLNALLEIVQQHCGPGADHLAHRTLQSAVDETQSLAV